MEKFSLKIPASRSLSKSNGLLLVRYVTLKKFTNNLLTNFELSAKFVELPLSCYVKNSRIWIIIQIIIKS